MFKAEFELSAIQLDTSQPGEPRYVNLNTHLPRPRRAESMVLSSRFVWPCRCIQSPRECWLRLSACGPQRSDCRFDVEGSMKTVLILEDDPSNMQIFCALLWSAGYRVLEATTGEEALEIANHPNGAIDLFISDVAVPVLSGTEVALKLNKSHPATPILFVSGTPMYAWE